MKKLEGTISFILHVREPYDLDTMNWTVYQQVKFIKEEQIEDTGWWDKGPFKTLTVDVVLFPYVTEIIDNYAKSLSYTYKIPPGLEAFQYPTSTSDSCQELTDVISPIAKRARTLGMLGNLIHEWNWANLTESGFFRSIQCGELKRSCFCNILPNDSSWTHISQHIKSKFRCV